MHATKLCHKHVTLTDILAASTDIKSRDFSAKHNIPSTTLLQNNPTDQVADIDNVLLHNHYYQPPIYLDRVVKYIGDVGILVRLIGLHPIEFIELKNTLCQEPVLKESWNSLYPYNSCAVSLDTKVITLRIIYLIMQICVRQIRFTSPGEYHIAHDAAIKILTIVGWTTIDLRTAESNIILIDSIINFAVKGLIPENIKIILDKETNKLPGAKYIKVPIHTILTTIPDIYLLVNIAFAKNAGGYRFIRGGSIRDFITIQLRPYEINRSIQIHYKQDIRIKLSEIIKEIHHQDSHNYILMDKKKTEYGINTWHQHVIKNLGNLYYKGDKVLTIENIADNTELYNNLISLISADKFLAHMAEHEASFFYGLLNDDIQVLTEIEKIKNDMFIAFASAHMADILTRCGAVLTEDVFYTVFGIKPTHHHLRLLHRGILLRDGLMLLYQQSMINPNDDATNDDATNDDETNDDEICMRINIQAIRMSHQVALELLCTYFQGLDKIVKIKPSALKWLPGGAFNIVYKSTTLRFTNKISLIEYPLPLRVSFTESIYKSTEALLNLQKFLSKHNYIGINGVTLSGPINLDLNSLVGDDLKIFQYFTGYDNVVDFKEWVNELLTPPINDNRLSTLLYLANSRDVQEQFILIMIAMSVSNRDFTLLRREPYQLMKKGFKQVLFPKFDSDIFDKLHDYAQLMSSFLQYDNREKEVSSEVEENLRNTYINIISDNDVLFEVNIQQCDEVDKNYNIVSDALLKNTKEMLLRDTPKTILDGKSIQLTPYIINTITTSRCRKLYRNLISYTKFYKLSIHDSNTISNQQFSSSADTVVTHSQLFSIYPSKLPSHNDDTTLPTNPMKKVRVISSYRAETITIPIKLASSYSYNSIISTNHISSYRAETVTTPSTLASSYPYNSIISTNHISSYRAETVTTPSTLASSYPYNSIISTNNISRVETATSSKRSSIDLYNDDTTLSKKSRQEDRVSTHHVSIAESVTISSKSCNSTLHNSSCKLLHTTISHVLERDKNDIVSFSSKTNNITSEESNNSNYMGEQSGFMLSERSNKTCPTEYQQGYDFSTQEIYKNPIIDEEYRCVNNHVNKNIDLPSTANLIQKDFKTAVYNCQNECNTSPTEDDWWQNLCNFQNDDIPIGDIPIGDIPIDEILIDDRM